MIDRERQMLVNQFESNKQQNIRYAERIEAAMEAYIQDRTASTEAELRRAVNSFISAMKCC